MPPATAHVASFSIGSVWSPRLLASRTRSREASRIPAAERIPNGCSATGPIRSGGMTKYGITR